MFGSLRLTIAIVLVTLLTSASRCATPPEASTNPHANTNGNSVPTPPVLDPSNNVASTGTPTIEQIQAWIKQLGNDDFQTRETAQRELVKSGNPAYFALEALPPSDDPEVRARVERTLKALEDDAAETLRKKGARVAKCDSADEKYFVLKSSGARDDDLAPLARLRYLETMRLEDAPFTDKALDHCRHLSKLYSFASYHTEMTDEGLAKLRQFPNLAGVSLSLPKMTNKGMETLARLPKLRQLSIFDTPIDGEGLKHLRPLKDQIEVLELARTGVSDDDLAHLRDFDVLFSLGLIGTKVTGAGLRHIRDLPKLKSVSLGGIELADEAFVHLAKMPTLESVHLRDAGVSSENLLLLGESTSLVSIDISADELTEEEVDAIQKKFDARDTGDTGPTSLLQDERPRTRIHRIP